MNDYEVQAGDTLSSIAWDVLGPGRSYTELMRCNPEITDPNRISVGQIIKYPCDGPASPGPALASEDETPAPSALSSPMVVYGAAAALVAAGAYVALKPKAKKSKRRRS